MDNRIERLKRYVDSVLHGIVDPETRRIAFVHLYGVSQFCTLIALKRGEDAELAAMAGMLHDFYTYKGGSSKDHDVNGAALAREVLIELGVTNARETDAICAAIGRHSDKAAHHSPLGEVLVDADVLQHALYNPTVPVMPRERARIERLAAELGFPASAVGN